MPTAAATAVALLTTVLVASGAPSATAADPRGPELSLVSSGSPYSAMDTDTAMDNNGGKIAFAAPTIASGLDARRILVVENGNTYELPATPKEITAHAPSMSGDGSLVSYLGGMPQGDEYDIGDLQAYVVDRRNKDQPVLREVTSTPNDLPYQRVRGCIGPHHAQHPNNNCAPQLSRDGKTFVAPVTQSVDARELNLYVNDSAGQGYGLRPFGPLEPLIDLGAAGNNPGAATLDVRNDGDRAVAFPETGPTIAGDSGFSITPTDNPCAGVVEKGAMCTIGLAYRNTECSVESDATLHLPAPTSYGQMALKLTAGGQCAGSSTPPVARACTGPSEYPGTGRPEAREGHILDRVHHIFPLPSVTVGDVDLEAVRITNRSSTPQVPVLTSKGCEMRFVLPDAVPPDSCQPGQPIAAGVTCTAYVETKATEVAPLYASFYVGEEVYRVSTDARRNVIAAWRDPSGTGNFGASKAQIVSVQGSNNVPMDGSSPSVSADGRWIAYSSTSRLGQNPGVPSEEATQVYLHDTDAAGDGSRQPGQTILMSAKPDGSLPGWANQPSVSDDGSRVAFTGRGPLPNPYYTQVYVRDRTAGRTVLASATPSGGEGAATNSGPGKLSGDGGTVVFTSGARLMGEQGPIRVRIYARDLGKDFAGGRGAVDLVSVRPNGGVGDDDEVDRHPSVNQNGTGVAFVTDGRLIADDPSKTDVYRASRASNLTVQPATLDFGKVPARTRSGPQPMTVRNDGPAVMKLAKPQVSHPDYSESNIFRVASDQCTGRVIRAGESCSYTVEFAPKYVGPRIGKLSAYNESGANSGGTGEITVSGTGTSDARSTGETRQVAGDGVPGQPALSDDGRFVAMRFADPDSGDTSIRVRDMTKNDTTGGGINTDLISGEEHTTVSRPDVSGNARLVGYYAAANEEAPSNLWVADRTPPNGGQPVRHQVTGTTSDLRYQRTAGECYSLVYRSCKLSLSGDGNTIAFPAQLAVETPNLSFEQVIPENQRGPVKSVVDMGRGGDQMHQVNLTPKRAVEFDGVEVDGSSAFTVGSDCDGPYPAETYCYIQIRMAPQPCGTTANAVLRVKGTTPDARTEIRLIGNGTCTAPIRIDAPARPQGCDPMPNPTHKPDLSTSTTTNGTPLADLGANPVTDGRPDYAALVVRNPAEVPATIDFTPSCEFDLVTPPTADPAGPACRAGVTVAPGAACVAYMAYRPETVGVSATNLSLRYAGGSDRLFRFAGSGYQSVVLVRSDPTGAGDFAGAGKPAPKIVSVDSTGQGVDGGQPSLSGDGRYVAFEGDDARNGRYAPQIWRHDRRTGETVLASQLSDGSLDSWGATAPSLSRSGTRVAFQTRGERPGEGPGRQTNVWVRDIASNRTVLASAADGSSGQRANGWSEDPALSDDGSTVAFTSDADDLVEPPGNEKASVYVRYLTPDFAGAGERFNERVALDESGAVPEQGASETPAINQDGAFTAFGSQSKLTASDTDNGTWDVFTRRRLAQLLVEPVSVNFGPARVGTTTAPKEMRVRNIGMGPAAAGPGTVPAPFAVGQQKCTATLHRGESCVVDATFAPTTDGRAEAVLGVPSTQGYLAGPSVAVTLSGVGVAAPPKASYTITPTKVSFGTRKVGEAGPWQQVTVKNNGDVPLAIATQLNSPDGDFSADSTRCANLQPATECTVDVMFVPRKAGERFGTLGFNADAQDPNLADPNPQSVALTGTGEGPPAPPGLAAMRVGPPELVFEKPQVLLSKSQAKVIVVQNTGTVPLVVSALSTGADFITNSTKCQLLRPGKSCVIGVAFVPRSFGAPGGSVDVQATTETGEAADPFAVSVPVRGVTATPNLTFQPPVIRPGQVIMVTGQNFPPGRKTVLAWQTGLGSTDVVADKFGRFTTPVFVFRRDVHGPRRLAGLVPGLPAPVFSPYLLVSRPSLYPGMEEDYTGNGSPYQQR